MNRKQFMDELEKLLRTLPPSEREEALQYYNDYFDDAGKENEAQVIKELGSPKQVARTILEGSAENAGEYTEHGYEDPRFHQRQEMAAEAEKSFSQNTRKNPNFWKILCIVLLCILLGPIVLPLGAAAFIALLGIGIGIIGLMAGISVMGVVFLISGVIVIGYGIFKLFLTPAVGAALGGIGCLILAAGILITLLIIWCFVRLIPLCIRGIVSLIRFPLRKAGIVK